MLKTQKHLEKQKKDKMLNVSSPTFVGAGINLKEIRLQAYEDKTQAIDEVSMAVQNILTQMYKDGLENIQMPDVVQRVQAELETIKIHLQKELNVERMAQTLSDISQKETNIKYRVTYKVMLRYIHDLLRLQQVKEKLKARPEKLDIDWVAENKESITKNIKKLVLPFQERIKVFLGARIRKEHTLVRLLEFFVVWLVMKNHTDITLKFTLSF